jgi:hypothetical protein
VTTWGRKLQNLESLPGICCQYPRDVDELPDLLDQVLDVDELQDLLDQVDAGAGLRRRLRLEGAVRAPT